VAKVPASMLATIVATNFAERFDAEKVVMAVPRDHTRRFTAGFFVKDLGRNGPQFRSG
jgi:hypothetical protein